MGAKPKKEYPTWQRISVVKDGVGGYEFIHLRDKPWRKSVLNVMYPVCVQIHQVP